MKDSLKEIFDKIDHHQPIDFQSCGILPLESEDWKDYFVEGVKLLKENNLNLAEQYVSRALKVLSASPAKGLHLNKEKAECFHSLSELYLSRASHELKKEDFCEMVIKSIALSEAERIYKHGTNTEDKEIDSVVSGAELTLVEKVLGEKAVERFKNAGDRRASNRMKLDEIRSRITNVYFPKLASVPEWDTKDEQERCDAIESIYEEIHDDMKRFINEIFHYCSEITGPAPCNFSVLGLGSTSRKEGTPYSDLEFAILIEGKEDGCAISTEHRTYFRFFTYFIQAQIVKLGETILPSLGIASLNDHYTENKEDDWFYDDMVPKGFSFDGMMPWACKTPLGRKAWRGDPPQEFIMSVDEMLELQNITPASCDKSLETANVFSSVCHLYGDTELTRNYQKKLSAMLIDSERVKTFQQQVLTIMQNLTETYRIDTLTSNNYGTQQDVKREVYRLASLLVEQISKFFGIFGRSSWQCVKEMSEKKILTQDGGKNLLTVLSITTELRLRCYQSLGRQKEALPTVPQLSVDEMESSAHLSSNTAAIVRLYQSLIPLKSAVDQIVKNQVSVDPESFMRYMFLQQDFLDVSPFTKAMAYLRILQLPKALACLCSTKDHVADDAEKVDVILVLADCYRMVGKFQKVFECCREVQTLYSMAPESIPRKGLLNVLIMKMHAFVDLGRYQEAVTMHDQIMAYPDALDAKEDSIREDLDFLNSSAVLFMKLNQYSKAESILKCVIKKLPKPRNNYSCYFSCTNNLAVIFLEEERLTEAKTTLENALTIANELYGVNAIHPHVASCLTNLSKVHYGLQNTQEANRLLQLALIIYHHVHDQQLIEPSIVDALMTKAKAFQFAGKWEEMRGPLLEAKEVARVLYRDQPHPIVASVFFRLGFCEQVRGKYSTALRHYQDCLKIREYHRKESGESGHNCETASVLLRIASLGKMCYFEGSYILSLIQQVLEIEEQVHGKGSNHHHLAICFGRLGYFLMQESSGAQGLEYIERAIQMFQEMKSDDTYEYGYEHLGIGIVLRDVSPNKAEKHLRIAETVLKKILKDETHIVLLEINSTLLRVLLTTNRIQEGLELANVQRHLIEMRMSKYSQLSLSELDEVFSLATFYEASGRRNTAAELYTDLISRLEEHVDPTDPEDEHLMLLLWTTQEAVAEIYKGDEMFEKAEAMFQRCFVSTQKSTSQRPFVKEVRHVVQWKLASIFTHTGRDSQAYDILDSLVKTYERDPERVDSMLALSVFQLLGELKRRRFLFDLALQDLHKALKMANDLRAKAMCTTANEAYVKIMNTIGLVYEQGNDLQRAMECYKCCLDAVEGQQPTMDTATAFQNMADTLKKLGSPHDALVHYKKSLEIREMLHSEDPVREDIATVLYHIADTQFMSEKPKEASETLDKLLPLRKKLLEKGCPLQNYYAAVMLKGNCHLVQPDEAQKAKEAYQEAEKVLKKMTEGQPNKDYAAFLGIIGYACQLLNQWDEAISKLREALQMKRVIYSEVKSSSEVALACFLLAEALLKYQKHDEALTYFKEALEIHEALRSTNDVVESLLNIAQCYRCLKNIDKAMEIFGKVEELCSICKTLDDRMVLRFHEEMADVYMEEECEDKAKGLLHLQDAETILERIKETEKDEEKLNELQAKILSLQIA